MVKRIFAIMLLSLLLVGCSSKSDVTEEIVEFPENTKEVTTDNQNQTDSSVSVNEGTYVTDDITTEPSFEENNIEGRLAGKVICIDPGHGSFTNGYQEPIGPGSSKTKPAYVSGTSGIYQTEAEFNLKLSVELKAMLEGEGAVVYMTREDEKSITNIERAEFANEKNCDMVVRIHADGSENTSISGISVLIPAYNEFLTDSELIDSSRLAGQYVLDEVLNSTGAIDRGLILRDDLTGFNWTKVPCILVECGFMSNAEDDRKLADPAYRTKLADGITKGLIAYYETV